MLAETALQHYSREALKRATFEPMKDGRYVGLVPGLDGVIAFADTERECVVEIYSVAEDWTRFRVERGLHVPAIGGVDLNTEENLLRTSDLDRPVDIGHSHPPNQSLI